jgi:serine O-acetyltransferase
MISSLTTQELLLYTAKQLDHFFPDGRGTPPNFQKYVQIALSRLEHCFCHVANHRYYAGGQAQFNHLYSDHYMPYLWFLSNTIWRNDGDPALSNKVYYLNKSLHGFDCMYDTALPDIFLIFHGCGTVLGKARYSDYLVVLQGCTVGAHHGRYPNLGRGVALTAHSAVIGGCDVGDCASVGCYTTIFARDIPRDTTAYRDTTGSIVIRPGVTPFAQQFFTTPLRQATSAVKDA